jgi:RHS repeat-associated protein
MIDGSEGEVAYNYGPNGRLKSQDLPRGSFDDGVISDSYIRNEFEIDDLGYINIAIFGSNTAKPRRWSFDRNAEGFPTVVHDPLGQVTHLEYDERNLLLSQTLFSGTTEERTNQFGYDHNGNLIRYVDTAGLQTDYDYDSWDRLGDSVLPGINGSRTHVHSIYGLKDQIKRMETIGIPAPGATPTVLQEQDNQYDQRGRLVLRKQSGLTTTIWYDEDSCPTKSIDHRGNVNSYNCDALGRIILTQDQLGNLIIYIFDTNGNLTTLEEKEIEPGSSTPKIYKTNLIYDDRNRLIQLNDSLGNTVKTKYDDRDLIVAGTTELGIRNEYEYDLEGEFVVARGFVAQPTLKVEHRWERDLLSRVTKYTDPEGKSTQYDYNAEARWKKISLADGSSQQRIFDNAGRLSKEVRSSGISSEYSYGSDGLIDRIRFNTIPGVKPVPDINYERDGMGRVVNASQGATTIKLQYDSLGRLLSEAMAGITTQWKFDDHNGFAELAYPDGRVDRYEYDALGRVSRITLQRIAPQSPLTGNSFTAGSLLAGYEYVGPQRIHARTLGNGCITHYSYDQGRRLSGIEHLTKGGNILALVQYVYDSAGRRKVMRAEPSPGTSYIFDYDSLSRLSSVKEGFSAPSIPSNLDQLGSDNYVSALGSTSMLRKTRFDLDLADSPKSSISIGQAGSTVDNFVTDEVHKIRQITRTTPNASSTQTFSHDDDGNRVKDHNFTYVYDAIGRLREIRNLATNEVLFTQDFDPLGRATNTTIRNGISENHRYLGVRLVEDETSGGNVLRQYCMGIQLGEYISKSEGGEVWGHQDARLSLLAVSDNSGNPVERYSYSTFGMPSIWSSDGMVIRDKSNVRISPIFGGHNSIGLKGIYDARARIYDADTGYFLQRDPRGYINSANPYSYVSHNPIDFIDPTGEILPVIAAIVILGAVSGGGYSVYDSYHHPELYEGWSILKGFSNTVIGAVIGAASGLGGEAVLGAAGTGSLVGTGSVTAASTLTLSQSMALTGTVSATSGLIWRSGFNGLFPEYVEPPSIESSGFDFALGAVGPIIGRTMETASVQVWNSVRTGLNSVRTGVTNIVRGPWRPFGNTWKLLLNPRTKYNPLNLIWDDRTRNAVSKQYWRSTANGNSLQHLWVMESTRWVRQGIRSAGLNLIEVPLSYNRWMSNIPARNYAFRFGVASVLTATATGSGILTYKTLDYWTSNRDVNQTKGVDGMDTISNIPGNTSSNVSSPTKTSGTTFSDK